MKNQIVLYKLKFHSDFHVDSFGNNSYSKSEKFIHSDTLSSAILSLWASQNPDSFKNIKPNSLPYLLSSAFPFYGEILFLPVLRGRKLLPKEMKLSEENKKAKKVEFLPIALWEKFIKKSNFYLEDLKDYTEAPFLTPKNSNKEKQAFYKEERRYRTSVTRNQSEEEGSLFQFSSIRYSSDSGLYFLAQFTDSKAQTEFEEMLALLGDTGIGADKSSGKGQFSFQKEDSPIKTYYKNEPSFMCNLSVFSPRVEEIKNKDGISNSNYELIKRGGWIHNQPIRKNSLFMFKEGSCFPYKNYLKGEVKDITPNPSSHKVWRDGRAFWIYF